MFRTEATSMPVNATGRFQSVVLPTILLLLLQMVVPLFGRSLPHIAAAPPHPIATPNPEQTSRVAKNLARMPMSFERNDGQTSGRVKFTAHGQGYQLFLTPTEAILGLGKMALRMKLVGASTTPNMTGVQPLATVSNYYVNQGLKYLVGY